MQTGAGGLKDKGDHHLATITIKIDSNKKHQQMLKVKVKLIIGYLSVLKVVINHTIFLSLSAREDSNFILQNLGRNPN